VNRDVMVPLYDPKPDGPMNVIALASTSGTNMQALFEYQKGYEIKGVFVDKLCGAKDRAEKLGLPVIYESGYKHCGNFSDAKENGTLEEYAAKCAEYENIVVERLGSFAYDSKFDIDFIFLAGYMRIVGEPLLNAYPDKMINVHPGRLATLDQSGRRIYTGDDAVMKAIVNREKETYSTVHLVTGELDGGEIIVTSGPCPVTPGLGIDYLVNLSTVKNLKDLDSAIGYIKDSYPGDSELSYAALERFCDQHQDKQKKECDWPAFTKAAELIAAGRVDIGIERNSLGLRNIYIDCAKMPYQGFELK